MIGFLPEPYPDELLFSVISRYAELTNYQNVRRLNMELFDSRGLQLPVAIPANLASLVAKLPIGHNFSVERLINEHTLLPLFAPFISRQRYQLVRNDMKANRAAQAHGRLGINNFKGLLKFFRYCPQCVTDDRRNYKETYWHRLHHIASIDLCPLHDAYLKDSHTSVSFINRSAVFLTAEEALKGADLSYQTEVDEHLRIVQKKLANNASWLLEHHDCRGYQHSNRNFYLKLLFKRRLCTFSGTVKRKRLVSELTSYYSSDLLKRLNCEVTSKAGHDDWLVKLVHRRERAIQPIHHLLMLQFLSASASELVEKSTVDCSVFETSVVGDPNPFGRGPWPCLNATAQHFKQDVVVICEVLSAQRYPRPPRGIFRCSCGFVYSRLGPEKSASDRYKHERYINFGEHWDNTVKEMIAAAWTTNKIARALGISRRIIKLQLARLGLNVAHRNISCVPSKPRDLRRIPAADFEERRQVQRSKLLAIRLENPKFSRSKIRLEYSAVYSWLYVHDRDWLLANLPPRLLSSDTIRPKSKWLLKDAKLAEAVTVEAARLRALCGRPEIISETAIASNLGILHVWSKRRHVLPLTSIRLHEVAETWEGLALRRVDWAAQCFAEQGLSPAWWRIVQLAGISGKLARIPTIRAAIDQAVAGLKSQMELNYSEIHAAYQHLNR